MYAETLSIEDAFKRSTNRIVAIVYATSSSNGLLKHLIQLAKKIGNGKKHFHVTMERKIVNFVMFSTFSIITNNTLEPQLFSDEEFFICP